jgi:hypothetical protein
MQKQKWPSGERKNDTNRTKSYWEVNSLSCQWKSKANFMKQNLIVFKFSGIYITNPTKPVLSRS